MSNTLFRHRLELTNCIFNLINNGASVKMAALILGVSHYACAKKILGRKKTLIPWTILEDKIVMDFGPDHAGAAGIINATNQIISGPAMNGESGKSVDDCKCRYKILLLKEAYTERTLRTDKQEEDSERESMKKTNEGLSALTGHSFPPCSFMERSPERSGLKNKALSQEQKNMILKMISEGYKLFEISKILLISVFDCDNVILEFIRNTPWNKQLNDILELKIDNGVSLEDASKVLKAPIEECRIRYRELKSKWNVSKK